MKIICLDKLLLNLLVRKKIFILILAMFFPYSGIYLFSQHIRSTVELDTNEILIGDQINLNIFVSSPKENKIIWPEFSDTLTGDIEIIEKSKVDTSLEDNENIYSQRLRLTVFDSGFYYIPPVKFSYKKEGDTSLYYFESDPIPLTVNTLKVDTSQVIKDIKSPLEAPLTFREIMPWILFAIALIAIAYFVVYYINRRKQKKPVFRIRPKPKIPPHRKALEDLEKLKSQKLWQNGKVKEYHSRLTEILRIYIEERFRVMAVEMTTNEIINGLKRAGVEKSLIEKINQILVLADFVKFAKFQPLPLEHDASYNNAVDFVNATMQKKSDGNDVKEEKEIIEEDAVITSDKSKLSEDEK